MTKKLLITTLILVILAIYGQAQVTVDFSASVTRSCVSTQVVFTNLSTSTAGSIVDLEWDIAGIYANKENPSTIFTDPGGYDVCLIATDEAGNKDTLCRQDFVIIWEKPVANFVTDTLEGCSPLQIEFFNTSTSANGEIAESIWDVGGSANLVIMDSIDSTVSSTYITPGPYSASLFVKDDKGCTATIVKDEALKVYQQPTVEYTFEVVSGCELPWEVQFNNIDPPAWTNYTWDFGNGQTYEGVDPPLIVYDSIGNFDLTIAIERSGCPDTVRSENLINPGSAPDFSVSPIGACIDTELTFFESSQISADSIFWDFGDGTTSTDINAVHTYSVSDCYEVTMIRYSGECIDTVSKPCVMINPKPEVQAQVDNQFSCTLPVELGLSATASEEGTFTWEVSGVGTDKILFEDTTSLLINQNGSYNVSLQYVADNGCVANVEDFPVLIETFKAKLPTQITEGCSPLSVTLQDEISSNLDVTSWQWSVLDQDSVTIANYNSQSPSFMLSDTGRYDIQLIVESETGCIDTVYSEEYIKVGNMPTVDFTATPLEDCIFEPKNFTPLTSDFADSWVWGTDGTDTISVDQFPSILLTQAKPWDISLTAYHNGCSNSIIKEGYINILQPGVAYRLHYDCDNPYTVDIEDFTSGADSSYWVVELSSTQKDTFFNTTLDEYTFPDRGKYYINHYAINYGTGCEHYRSDTIIITDPQARMTLDTIRGCAPLTINVDGDSQDDLYIEYVIPGATIDSSLSVTDPSIIYTESGPFQGPQLIITDYHGCQDTMSIMDSIHVNKATAIPGIVDGVCIPDSTEVLDQSTDRLGEIVERKWYFDNASVYSEEESFYVQINENRFYDIALAVVDNWGCKDSIYIKEAIYGSRLDPSFTASDSIPCTNYGISFSIDNTDQQVVDYLWDFGDGTTSSEPAPIHAYDSEGVYTVCLTINDQYNCPRTECRNEYINVKNPVASFSGDPIYETCPPLITNFINSSLNASNFSWNFGDNSGLSDTENPSHLYNEPGKFTVSLIASNTPFCADTLTIVDYVFVDGPSGNFEFISDSSCLPLTITLIANSDDVYTFGWDYGNGETSISDTPRMTDTLEYKYQSAGTFLPKLILSDGNGCIRSFSSDSIGVNSISLDFSSDVDTSCIAPIDINLENLSQSTDPSMQYKWEVFGSEDYEFDTDYVNFNIVQPGAYTVQLSAMGNNCIDTITKNSVIQIATQPEVSFDFLSDQACEEVTAIFNNNTSNIYGEISEYFWDFGDGTTSDEIEGSHLFTEAENILVTLTAISEFGCSNSYSEEYLILPNAVPSLPPDYSMCIGDSVLIEGTIVGSGIADMALSWNLPNDLSCIDCLQPIANPVDTTQYIITAAHSNGCVTMDTMLINVVPVLGPTLSLSMDTVVCAMDTAIVSITNFNNSFTYEWTDSPTLNCLDCEYVSAYPEDDTYYTVTVYNEYGCFKTDSLLVEVEREIPDFLIDDRGICEDATTILTVADEVNNPIWENDNSLSCLDCYQTSATPSINKYYYVNVTSDVGCDYRDSVFVTIIPKDSLEVSNGGQICVGEQFTLASSGAGDPLWTPSTQLNSPTEAITFSSPLEPTLYTITYTFDECIQYDSIMVDVISKAEIWATGDTICEDQSAELIASGNVNRFTWIDELGAVISTGDTLILDAEVDQDLMVIGKLGLCEEDTAMVSIKVEPEIDVSLGNSDYELFINSAEVVDIDYDAEADYVYSWFPSNGLSCDDCPAPKISDIGQAMQYTLTVYDELTGCDIDKVIDVRFINQCSDKAFYIPNIFSPNGDGSNDYFYILAERPEEFDRLILFDRWGNQIYGSTDVLGRWDGNYRGQPIGTGVYPYRIDYTCTETGEQFAFYGDVTVIR